jgi:hypothetical protein
VGVEGARRHRLLIYVAGAILIFSIAVSRVLLRAHSLIEAGFGLIIGLGALAVFAGGYLARRSPVNLIVKARQQKISIKA